MCCTLHKHQCREKILPGTEGSAHPSVQEPVYHTPDILLPHPTLILSYPTLILFYPYLIFIMHALHCIPGTNTNTTNITNITNITNATNPNVLEIDNTCMFPAKGKEPQHTAHTSQSYLCTPPSSTVSVEVPVCVYTVHLVNNNIYYTIRYNPSLIALLPYRL
ncbi:hypothetical protein NECID01_0709 [Nematocida sp. AWRm77]|nr:hypothetical protein NECID01_0709 [Nematocida sp. AWRm77]